MNGKHLFHYKSCEDSSKALHSPRSRENLNKTTSYENRQKEAAKRLSQDHLKEIKKHPELFQKLLDKAMKIEKEKTPVFTYELSFSIKYETLFGERVVITGEPDFLGNWDPFKGLELEWTQGGTWKAKVLVGEGSIKEFEYKYVCIKKHEIRWESGNNRIFNSQEGIKQNSLILFNREDLWQAN